MDGHPFADLPKHLLILTRSESGEELRRVSASFKPVE
jgi:hypothetical protein